MAPPHAGHWRTGCGLWTPQQCDCYWAMRRRVTAELGTTSAVPPIGSADVLLLGGGGAKEGGGVLLGAASGGGPAATVVSGNGQWGRAGGVSPGEVPRCPGSGQVVLVAGGNGGSERGGVCGHRQFNSGTLLSPDPTAGEAGGASAWSLPIRNWVTAAGVTGEAAGLRRAAGRSVSIPIALAIHALGFLLAKEGFVFHSSSKDSVIN